MPSDSSATMKPGVPWSVKGVGPDARETAKEAARRAGMTLGEWLNTVIARKAQDPATGALEDPLARLIASLDPPKPAASADGVEARLAAALADGRRRTEAVEAKTASALQSLIGWVERSDAMLREDIGGVAAAQERATIAVRDALALVVARLDAVEHKAVDAAGQESATLREAFAALEKRLDTLDRDAREGVLQPHVGVMLTDLEDRLTALAARMDEAPRASEPAPGVPPKLEEILDRLPDPRRVEAAAEATTSALDRLQEDLARLSAKLDEERPLADLDDLRQGMGALARAVHDADPGERLDAIQAQLAALGGQMDRLGDVQPDLDLLRRDIVTRLDRLAEPRPLPELEGVRTALGAVVAAVRANAPDAKLDAIAEELRNLRTNAAPAEDTAALEGVNERLDGIEARLHELAEDERLADLIKTEMRDRMAALHEILASSSEPALRRSDVEDLVGALADRIEQGQRGEAEIQRRLIASLEDNLVRAVRHDGEGAPAQPDPALERRIAELAERIERIPAASTTAGELDEIRARLDAVQGMVGDVLRAAPDISRLENLIREFGEKLSAPPGPAAASPTPASPAPSPAAPALAMTVAEKIAAAAAAAQTARAIGADLPRRPGAPLDDAAFEFGAPLPIRSHTVTTPALPRATPDFIAAARRASQFAQTQKPEGQAETDKAGDDAGGRGPRSPLILGAVLMALALGAVGYGYIASGLRQGGSAPVASVPPAPAIADAGGRPAPADPESVGAIGNAPQAVTPSADAPGVPTMSDLQAALMPKGLLRAARGGNGEAAYEIAVRLADGQGVPRDAKTALRWFEFAARQGVAPAQYRFAAALEKGLGAPADVTLAKSWYLRAAEKGHVRSMHNLGVLFADGAGATPNYAGAAQWFRRAAELGLRDSQYNLAILSARGIGGPQDLSEAWVWFSLAASQGDEDAARKRDEVAARMDAATLAKARTALADFHLRPVDRAANEVSAPAGGWDDVADSQKRS